jgi:hypothetical protein
VREWFADKGFDLRVEQRDAPGARIKARRPHAASTGSTSCRAEPARSRFARTDHGRPSSTPSIATEQRWLAEQDGAGAALGATYLEKTHERLRRGHERPPAGHGGQ